MSVVRTVRPIVSRKFERSGRPRGCHPGLSVTSSREEGGNGRHDATWPIRPTDTGVGFSSVLLTESLLAVPSRHAQLSPKKAESQFTRRHGREREEHQHLGLTRSPPTGNLYHQYRVGLEGRNNINRIRCRRPKRRSRATSHRSAGSPVLYLRVL